MVTRTNQEKYLIICIEFNLQQGGRDSLEGKKNILRDERCLFDVCRELQKQIKVMRCIRIGVIMLFQTISRYLLEKHLLNSEENGMYYYLRKNNYLHR